MDLFRFYCHPISKPLVQLPASEVHHLASVLRLARGDKVELFDGTGALAVAEITTVSPRSVTLQVQDLQVVPRLFSSQITIAVSIAKGDRLDRLIGKCTELGVDRICPVLFERTVKRPKNPKTIQRWRNLTITAAKQSGRLFLPHIDNPLPLPQALATLKEELPTARFLLGSLSTQSPALIRQPFGSADVVAFVGPEGGLTEQEQIFLQNHGSQLVRLTDTVLRVETAALAFAAILTAQRDLEKIERTDHSLNPKNI